MLANSLVYLIMGEEQSINALFGHTRSEDIWCKIVVLETKVQASVCNIVLPAY